MTARTVLARACVALGAVLLAGCGAHDPELDSLRGDPLVTARVSGLTETQFFGQVEFTSLGKHQPATLTRLFQSADHTVTPDDLARVALQADSAGWAVSPGLDGAWTGTKKVDGLPTTLEIHRGRSSTPGTRGALVVVTMTAAR